MYIYIYIYICVVCLNLIHTTQALGRPCVHIKFRIRGTTCIYKIHGLPNAYDVCIKLRQTTYK